MIVQAKIESKLAQAIDLQHLEVVNESGNHNVPAGSESHFKVVLVSDTFIDLKLIARHKRTREDQARCRLGSRASAWA